MKCFRIKHSMIFFLLSMCLAMSAQAAQCIYWGIAEHNMSPSFAPIDAFIFVKGQNILVSEFMGDRLDDTMVRIRLASDNSYISSYTEYGDETDPELGQWVGSTGSGYNFSHYLNFIKFDSETDLSTISVIFELGVNEGYSEDFSDPGYFKYLGESNPISLGSIDYRYIRDDTNPIPPGTQANEFGITQFYAPVPEPSSISLFLSGLLILMLSRKRPE